jgi:hypothetical protein
MTPRFRRIAVFVGTAALAAGTGIGVAASNDDPSGPTRSNSAPGLSRQQGPGGGGGPGAADVSALADALGVSETRLQEAMQATRPTDPGAGGGGPDEMIQALADELDLSVAKVRQAFESAAGGSQTTPPPSRGTNSPS